MTDVREFRPKIVGDGRKLDADDILRTNVGIFRTLVLVGEDENGGLVCASTDGRPDAITLLERAKAKIIAGYED